MGEVVTKRQRVAIYREAARLIAEWESDRSCWAILKAEGKVVGCDWSGSASAYSGFMLNDVYSTWALPWGCDEDSQEAQNIRVLLLCFMAAAVATGDA